MEYTRLNLAFRHLHIIFDLGVLLPDSPPVPVLAKACSWSASLKCSMVTTRGHCFLSVGYCLQSLSLGMDEMRSGPVWGPSPAAKHLPGKCGKGSGVSSSLYLLLIAVPWVGEAVGLQPRESVGAGVDP